MTPAARLQAAADILDQLSGTRATVEAVLKQWGQVNRYAGSKDRRAIADRVYRCLRAKQRLLWAMELTEKSPGQGRALVLASLSLIDAMPVDEIESFFGGEGYGPKPLTAHERERLVAGEGEAPAWVTTGLPEFVVSRFEQQFGKMWTAEATALMMPRAPIDLRVNSSKATRADMITALEAEGLSPEPTPFSKYGIRLTAEPPPNLVKLDIYQTGQVEIQDEGSQLAAFIAGAGLLPGAAKVVDFCAGGGGKTLALAQMMANSSREMIGEIYACDVVEKRLKAIEPRLIRAGATAHFIHFFDPDDAAQLELLKGADLVLVDAPCSGSGTWRRHPEDAHRIDEAKIEALHTLQTQILDRAAQCVKVGGRLVYVTCSVLDDENVQTADAFEAAHPNYDALPIHTLLENSTLYVDHAARLTKLAKTGHRLYLTPHTTQTDGFFIAAYTRIQ